MEVIALTSKSVPTLPHPHGHGGCRLVGMDNPIFVPVAAFKLQRDVVARKLPAATTVFADN